MKSDWAVKNPEPQTIRWGKKKIFHSGNKARWWLLVMWALVQKYELES